MGPDTPPGEDFKELWTGFKKAMMAEPAEKDLAEMRRIDRQSRWLAGTLYLCLALIAAGGIYIFMLMESLRPG